MDDVEEVVELEVGDVVGDDDGGEELEEDPVYSFNTLLNSVDVGVLVDDVGEEVELCELALWLLGVDVEELVDGEDDGVELVGVDVGEDGVEDEGAELCELVDVDEGAEPLLCELALSIVFIASLRNCA